MDVHQTVERLRADGIDVVRVTYPDLVGIDRGRDVLVERLPAVMEHGLAFCRAVYHTSPQGDVVEVAGGLDAGLPDICVRPDLATLAALPWEPGVAQCLGEAYEPDASTPCEEAPREVLRRSVAALTDLGLTAVAGPELEYFVCEPDPAAPSGWRRYGDAPGNVYTAGRRGDPEGHLLTTLRALRDFGLGVTMGNHEFCGGQFEINLDHSEALDAADRTFRFKGAVKELERRAGRMATFMAKPFNDEGGSGFHVHLSCLDETGGNIFEGPEKAAGLSEIAHQAIAGVLAHAPALAALFNPTINSYKRFGPDTLAPWLIDWGLDNRSAMIRVPPERGAGTRFEVRLGDASANPYLGMAGLLAAVSLGVREKLTPPAPLEGYGYDASRSAVLPADLPTALDALEADQALTAVLGDRFVSSFLAYKRDEVARFQRHVTDWEFREYGYHL
ncbi:glutamine synthetase [Actinomadura barringtoniae]|uniref:Glutamine synthetase n=1 Tax=Actinomadura barringtoniae TaxID=1427535 RepID=A0A939P612_9ACTN|nr:glutamine synthetase family protein [Actinomadura barringtoniae]MBO2445725.1 glutamine synthetase [Actinomadura barringtoniae]